ncbi:hypothetical protein QJS04_geneDACA021659 [Acorus gramineus]|uniref:Nucleolar complex protein 2 homolog n=1 Tax=Acorus gramineus TaxID=55184 RepID=A0AAV9AEQ0_ACOGR|nr:hypothetical protein QJS04_geneDACA021659 [Acorus gramineus]
MGKLGKKARKFAKKHLQTVLKKRRKIKSARDSKRRRTSRDESAEDHPDQTNGRSSECIDVIEAGGDISLDNLFSDDDDNSMEDVSESDGFLSEDEYPSDAEAENESDSEGESECSALLGQNKELHEELLKQKKKLDRLKQKDTQFLEFLDKHDADLQRYRKEESDSEQEVETNSQGEESSDEDANLKDEKILTKSTVEALCQLVTEEQNVSAFTNLLNGFRAACRYGIDEQVKISSRKIQNREAYVKILTFVLTEADGFFRKQLGISSSCCKKDKILALKSTSKWEVVRPLMKSYLRSIFFLLNQATDSHILAFTLSRLRASITFLVLLPSLLGRLIKSVIHFWATGEETLSLSSFFVLQDMASELGSDCLETILKKTYKTFIAQSKSIETTNLKRTQFLRDAVVEICCLDMQISYRKALISLRHLSMILQEALKTKKKELVNKICDWQYVNCIDVWVKFISANVRDHGLQSLLYQVIQILCGIIHLFPGPRYLPLRIKCIQMLNQLSSSSGVFIPIASLVLVSLEYRETCSTDARSGKSFNFSSVLKVSKPMLKSRFFREECVLSAIELLSAHFSQWSYHVSLPEVATIPLIFLKKFHEKTSIESIRRMMKHLIDQVEQNIAFIQGKRDEVTFSPKDQASVESFLQLEKTGGNAPFAQFYASVLQKSISRNLVIKEKPSEMQLKGSKILKEHTSDRNNTISEGNKLAEGKKLNTISNGRLESNSRKKKQRT